MKWIRLAIVLITGTILYTIVVTGLTKYVSRNNPTVAENKIGKTLTYLFTEVSDILYLVEDYFATPQYLLNDSTEKDGVTYFSEIDTILPKLLVSYQEENNNIVELIDLNNNKVLNSWQINNEHLKSSSKFVYYELRHPMLVADSSLIGVTNGNLVKFDSDDELVWKNGDVHFHHSIEKDHEGNIYVCGREWIAQNYQFQGNEDNFQSSLVDDLIIKADPRSGEILYKKSIIELLIENGYENLLYKNGFVVSDVLHLNDIEPARKASEYWEVGDLLVSLRSISVVFLYRPSSNTVLWLKQGPWLSQHDADFIGSSKIGVFGNDVIFDFSASHEKGVLSKKTSFIKGHNDFYIFDMETGEMDTPFSNLFESNNINTITSGRSELLNENLLFVEETNYGKIIIGDSIEKKLQFVRRIDEENISILNWSRLIK